MSADKLEVNCTFCGSILRVDSEHAGKRLRCPSCNNISDIPGQPNYGTSESFSQTHGAGNRPHGDAAFGDRPVYRSAPTHAPAGDRVFIGQLKSDTSGFVVGLAGLLLNLMCPLGCVSPLFVVANIWGLYKSLGSAGNLRQAGIILNSLALGIGLLRSGVLFMFGF